MKTIKKILIATGLFWSINGNTQTTPKKTCTVLDIDVVGSTSLFADITPSMLGNLTRRELSQLDIYEVSYHQDIESIIKKNKINLSNCYDIECLINAGEVINSDLMLSGYIEKSSEYIIISFREINVKTKQIMRSKTKEFKALPDQIKDMVILTLKDMYNIELDEEVEKLLTKDLSRDSYINNKGENRLNLSGTRMGFVYVMGDNSKILSAPESEGGFDAYPMLFQFGYQFETMYLNQGRMQGLFQFIPTVTGLEQGLFLPSMTVLHGIRDNKTGLEFAFGPTVGLTKKADGYYDDGKWKLAREWNDTLPNPNPILTRLDSRGNISLNPGFVFGVGYSIKSGNLNIPVNLFTVMQKRSFRVGLSVGINSKNR